MVDNHKPECLVKILGCCFQGHRHSRHSKFQLMFIWISSELPNLFLPKLGMVVQHHKLGCPANSWVVVLKVRSQGSESKYNCFYYIFWTANPFASKLWWYIIIRLTVWWKDYFTVFEFKVTAKVQNFIDCLDHVFWTVYVKVTVMAHKSHTIKIWLFVLYFQSCGFFCSQT